MFYLLSNFWLWLAVALIIGIVAGWMTFRGWYEGSFKDLWPWWLLLGIGSLIAMMKLLPAGIGFWFDLGMLMATFYFIGCFIGWLMKLSQGDARVVMPVAGASAGATTILKPAVKDTPVEPAKVATATADEIATEEAIIGLSGPRGGKADNLTCIYGIDDAMEARLNGFGIYHHDQLMNITPGQRRWLFNRLGHEGRFPSWWWRWRYDAEQIVAGKLECPPKGAAKTAPAAPPAAAAPAPAMGTDGHSGSKPKGLEGPRGGKADDLKRIRGIGKQNEGRLHALGIWHFDQIAAWSVDEALWVGSYLAFPGRIEREEWVSQAALLAAGKETDFSKRVALGEVATSKDDGNEGQGNVAKLDKPVTKPKT